MSTAQASTFTDSALSDKVRDFLTRFKDRDGNYKYVDAIDEMMAKNAKYIIGEISTPMALLYCLN